MFACVHVGMPMGVRVCAAGPDRSGPARRVVRAAFPEGPSPRGRNTTRTRRGGWGGVKRGEGGSGLGDGVDSGAGRYSGEGSSVCPSLAYCYMAVDSDSARIRLTDSDTVDSDTTAGLDTATAAG